MGHETILINHEGFEYHIDEKIAPLVVAIWKRGIKTKFSCQDYGESDDRVTYKRCAYIQFLPEELCKFLDIIHIQLDWCNLSNIIDGGLRLTKIDELSEWCANTGGYKGIHPWPFSQWSWEMYPVFDLECNRTILMTMAIFPIEHIKLLLAILDDAYSATTEHIPTLLKYAKEDKL